MSSDSPALASPAVEIVANDLANLSLSHADAQPSLPDAPPSSAASHGVLPPHVQPLQHLNLSPEVPSSPSPPRTRSTVSHLRAKIGDAPTFSGHFNENVFSFVSKMKLYLAVCHVPANEWVAYTCTQLRDNAAEFAYQVILPRLSSDDPIIQANCTWDNFVSDLYNRFQPYEVNRQAREELAALNQWSCKSQSSIQEYCSKFFSIVSRITDMNPADQIQNFVRGLKTKTQEKVEEVYPPPNTLNDAMNLAVRMDMIVSKRLNGHKLQSHRSSIRPSHPPPTKVVSSGPAPMELGNVEGVVEQEDSALNAVSGRPWYSGKLKENPGLREKLLKDGRCLFCREQGHGQEACSKYLQVKQKEQSKK